VLVGPVIVEILQGIAREAQANYVASLLRGVRYLEISWDDWQEAGRLGRRLAAAGHGLPMSDLILAAVARRTSAEVFTTDPNFDLVADLHRFSIS
jgi:predicted nucleic acid-binding protein